MTRSVSHVIQSLNPSIIARQRFDYHHEHLDDPCLPLDGHFLLQVLVSSFNKADHFYEVGLVSITILVTAQASCWSELLALRLVFPPINLQAKKVALLIIGLSRRGRLSDLTTRLAESLKLTLVFLKAVSHVIIDGH